MVSKTPLIFDGHNDVLLKLFRSGQDNNAEPFLSGRDGAIDLPKAIEGGFGGGFFAIYVSSDPGDIDRFDAMNKPSYDLPLPDILDIQQAGRVALAQASILFRLQQ